ncbi:MAG: hypothetical protein SCARUB_03430 [Candidatus Scalindua rubra]|uniref:Uncharacterized protein n=1 Tax=Candidatus Scalindua rubra TaxID=1872076 RepID=A0A1E3X787_9BACT|nr:MAG: hypothetical protein SCARUB_03430 [Candidatus Scalindua rubra]
MGRNEEVLKEDNVGRKNIIFGLCWLFLFMICGSVLEFTIGQSKWYQPVQKWGITPTNQPQNIKEEAIFVKKLSRKLLVTSHLHANEFALVNIVLGMIIGSIAFPLILKQIASYLLIAGTALFSLGLVFGGLVSPAFITPMTPFGGFCMIIGVLIVVVGKVRCVCSTSSTSGNNP